MSANRNQSCPCGSGRKYKKCCLSKQNVIQLHEVKVERFYQQKERMVENVRNFIDQKQSFGELKKRKSEFQERTSRSMSDKTRETFFRFWLHFFYKFENGLRGVEWYKEENVEKLSTDEITMLNTWIHLRPVIVQAIEIKGDIVIFEDVLSKRTYPVANIKDNIHYPIPWYGTIGLLEEFEGKYYFNGVRSYIGPKQIECALKKVTGLLDETKDTFENVMIDFFPEILASSLQDNLHLEKEKQKIITEYFATFYVKDVTTVKQFLTQHPDIDQDKDAFTWNGNWVAYRDTELDNQVGIGDVFGSIALKNNKLLFNTLSEEKLEEFKHLLNTNVEVDRVEIEEKHLTIPFCAEVSNIILSMDNNIPGYFSLYAQHSKMLKIDAPIPAYDNFSLRQLVDCGREIDADTWMKQSEYDLYRHAVEQFGSLEVTADFNTIRKQLKLPLSPFVTGGVERSTQLVGAIEDEDVAILGSLGFADVDHFFTDDILKFYKEKTTGKSNATIRKYRNALYDLRELLSTSKKKSWNDFTVKDWEKLISIRYIDLFDYISKTQIKDFLSIVKAFTKMLDDCYDLNVSKDVAEIAKKTEAKEIK